MIDFSVFLLALESHALQLGLFDRVNRAEPKSSPGSGLTCALWIGGLSPVARRSGLASTSLLLSVRARVYTSALAEPIEATEPLLLNATAALMESFTGDLTLGGVVVAVDILGQAGAQPLAAEAGYLDIDGKKYRVMAVDVPMIIDDAFAQAG